MNIVYQTIDKAMRKKIIAEYGNREARYTRDFETTIKKHVHLEPDSCSIAALHEGKPVGFISICTKTFAAPLSHVQDAYIDILEIDEQYRRQGIAAALVAQTETWAAQQGFAQIRSWSSDNKVEAISMWHALGYGLCPAKIWVEWCQMAVDGFYVVKKLTAHAK
ncbi:MAG: GNAT family N-acetyltransferase [Oscillospiraceae bacterium]|nr:GNAT family N-acetyltransferase [Oscillospiraceae bacterium]